MTVTGRRMMALAGVSRRSRPDLDFSRLYAGNAERVLGYLARRCRNPEVAADLMAETFARAFACRRQFRGRSTAEAEAWLFEIAANLVADYFRRGRAEQRAVKRLGLQVLSLDDEDQARIVELAGLADVCRDVRDRLEEIPEEQRSALQLRVVDELPYPEVASRLQVSEEAARARVSRALRRLSAQLISRGATHHE